MKNIKNVTFASAEFEDGVGAVLYIRCMEHRTVPAYNHNEISGAECAVCEIAKLEAELASARTMMEGCTGYDAYEQVNLWLEEHPTHEHPDVRNAPAGKDYDEYLKEATK